MPRGTLVSTKGAVGASFSQPPMEHAWCGEAKYPALLFKQQLAASVEKVYGLLRDSLKKDLIPVISQCIKAPKRTRSFSGSAKQPSSSEQSSTNWHAMIKIMTENMNILREKRVPPSLIRHLFTQTFAFINVHLFNSLLLRRECCSMSNGMYMREGIMQLAQWFRATGTMYAGSSWEELQHIRQAVEFLVYQRKPKATLDEIMRKLCPDLSVQQLYRISTMFWDEKYQTKTVSPEVMSMLRTLMMQATTDESCTESGNSFLLEDNTTIPFSIDDVSTSTSDVDVMNVQPPALLRNLSSFYFLKPLRKRHASLSTPDRSAKE
ncbi:hypothetical protein CBR_g55084 [Chara braunii]|uniref:Dilute domain-containing protein n=1 Tax=Chara braunii TaxID=69332 RepID=A0A388MCU2_CHABU|nr:hypothetical protein CBR_g55084 [Chara braunii]|eukprot:GBG92315.1 hypothetical protein CBR_g55084 [Chara braunii]